MSKNLTIHIKTKVNEKEFYRLVEQGIADRVIKSDTHLTCDNFEWATSSLSEDTILLTPVRLRI
jgi:hypothetical protein